MEQTSWSHYDFIPRKSNSTSLSRPMVQQRNMNGRPDTNNHKNLTFKQQQQQHRSSPLSAIPQKWETHSSAIDEDACAFKPFLATPCTTEMSSRVEAARGRVIAAAPSPYPCMATVQSPPSCSCRECIYYQNYYHDHQNHRAGYYSPYYQTPATNATTNTAMWTPADEERPIFRRRISDDSPRPSVMAFCRSLAKKEPVGQNSSNSPLGEDYMVDACDLEIEQITRKRGYDQTLLSRGQFERPPLPLSQPAVSFSNPQYYGCYGSPYPPLLQGASPMSQYYHPYHPPHPLPPVYYPNTTYQDPMYMYSYPFNSNPYYPESYPFYPLPVEETNSRKRRRHDDFLLRPQKDYIIYADRCSSPMSDITSSPTPSLSDFEQVEEMGRIHKDDLVVNVDSPPVELDVVPPRIERSVKDCSVEYTFENQHVSKEFVRTVSPIKPKVGEGMREGEGRDIWIKEGKEKKKAANCENNYLATISNNISQSSSEQWETDDV